MPGIGRVFFFFRRTGESALNHCETGGRGPVSASFELAADIPGLGVYEV